MKPLDLFPIELFNERIAFIDGDSGQSITYQQLSLRCTEIQAFLGEQKALVFIFCRNRLDEIVAYIGALQAGHVVCLLDERMPTEFKQALIRRYRPSYIYDGHMHTMPTPRQPTILHPQLQLLLTTSGTTGNPKLIRLSKKNLLSNAAAIIEYLGLSQQSRAIASLPIHYSYGLSVLHTHLLAGASIVLTQSSPAQNAFWQIFNRHQCSSLAGVPYTYTILERIGFEKLDLPSLCQLTVAGGKLQPDLVVKYHQFMQSKAGLFFVMYGQTEATARIAYVPPKYLPEKAYAIGVALPHGRLQIYEDGREIETPYQVGELVYQGENVMLGYATDVHDLAKGDEMHGVLRTGDLGYFDQDHIFYIKGRIKRISKVYGLRINLDDIEQALSIYAAVAATSLDNEICLYIENGNADLFETCTVHLAHLYHLHPSTFRCVALQQLPRTLSGKIDYQQL